MAGEAATQEIIFRSSDVACTLKRSGVPTYTRSKGAGNPDNFPGEVGDDFLDYTNGVVYRCTVRSDTAATWIALAEPA